MLTSIEKKINNQTNITQKYLSKISKNNKHSQYQFKPSYNTMQATCLLQLNNPPQTNLSKISKNNKWYQEKKNHCILFYL